MRPFVVLLLSTSALVAPLHAAQAEDVAWPELGGWGQAWEVNAPPPDDVPPAMAAPVPVPPPPVAAAPRNQQKITPQNNRADDGDRPISLTADEVSNDRELGIITARGSIDAHQGRRHLQADVLSYNSRHSMIAASGHVVLVEPSGDVVRTDYLEITDDFADGLAKQIQYMAADKSRVTAPSMTRAGGNRTDFDKASYTPCEPCKDHPDRAPVWQVNADRVTHKQDEQSVEYRDAWLDVAGVPVAYVPYLSTPDPTVRRRSGFLTPTFAGSTTLGESVTTPYYLVVSPQEDFTFFPRWMLGQITHGANADTADQAVLNRLNLGVQERWTGYRGAGDNMFSITENPTTHQIRGMINAKMVVDVNDTWRTGYNVMRLSDDTYARVYSYMIPGDKPWLSSRAYGEGFWDRDYAVVEAYSFQGITPGIDAATQAPWVMPHGSFSHVSSPGKWDDTWTWTADTLTYMRQAGTSASRINNNVAWNLPYRDALGQDWRVTSAVRVDGYHSDDYSTYGSTYAGRAMPSLAVNWKYPFTNTSNSFPQTISPLGMVAVSPNGGNPSHIPNEDSIDYELDDTNIFQSNRIVGLDRVEGGARGAYGLRWTGYTRQGSVLLQMAQGWRAHQDYEFDSITGWNGSLSDYVGRVSVDPGGNMRFTDRVRLDRDNLSAKRNEATIKVGPEALWGSVSYYYFEKNTPTTVNIAPDGNILALSNTSTTTSLSPYGREQQIYFTLESQLSRYWSIGGTYQDDLVSSQGGPIGWRAHLTYNDECFAFVGNVYRNFTYQNDYLAGITFAVNVVFKTFGQMPLTIYSD